MLNQDSPELPGQGDSAPRNDKGRSPDKHTAPDTESRRTDYSTGSADADSDPQPGESSSGADSAGPAHRKPNRTPKDSPSLDECERLALGALLAEDGLNRQELTVECFRDKAHQCLYRELTALPEDLTPADRIEAMPDATYAAALLVLWNRYSKDLLFDGTERQALFDELVSQLLEHRQRGDQQQDSDSNIPPVRPFLLNHKRKLLPQSAIANILAIRNDLPSGAETRLAYDHFVQRWLQYTGNQWREIGDVLAARIIHGWLEEGTGGVGYNIALLNGVTAFLKTLLATDGFDADPSLVPFRNGVLDLRAGRLLDHSPALKISWCLPFNYDPTATCEPVIAWLKECVAGDDDDLQVELLRAYLKAVITGRSDLQRYIELIGTGGTGKGAFIRLCTALIGSRNVHVTELKHLENNRFEAARLYRKRLCVITDAEKYSGDVSILKAMTGEDDLRYEEKHKQGGENFRFKGMVLISANQEIASNDHTAGLQRRRITVRFDNQADPAKRRDLESEFQPCLPGVVAWALALPDARLKELLVETERHVPAVGRFNLNTLKATNPLAAWADARLVLAKDVETPVGVKRVIQHSEGDPNDPNSRDSWTVISNAESWLYPNYIEWCLATGHKELALRNFSPLLKDLLCHQLKLAGVEKLENVNGRSSRFKGVRLRRKGDKDIPNLLTSMDSAWQKHGFSMDQVIDSTERMVNLQKAAIPENQQRPSVNMAQPSAAKVAAEHANMAKEESTHAIHAMSAINDLIHAEKPGQHGKPSHESMLDHPDFEQPPFDVELEERELARLAAEADPSFSYCLDPVGAPQGSRKEDTPAAERVIEGELLEDEDPLVSQAKAHLADVERQAAIAEARATHLYAAVLQRVDRQHGCVMATLRDELMADWAELRPVIAELVNDGRVRQADGRLWLCELESPPTDDETEWRDILENGI